MDEHRAASRRRVLKAGTISFNRAGGITCTVRDLSASGARLEVESPVGIPASFDLVIDSDQVTRHCEVVWRAERRIGVVFK
jgi:hypothetical protein